MGKHSSAYFKEFSPYEREASASAMGLLWVVSDSQHIKHICIPDLFSLDIHCGHSVLMCQPIIHPCRHRLTVKPPPLTFTLQIPPSAADDRTASHAAGQSAVGKVC